MGRKLNPQREENMNSQVNTHYILVGRERLTTVLTNTRARTIATLYIYIVTVWIYLHSVFVKKKKTYVELFERGLQCIVKMLLNGTVGHTSEMT